MIQLFFICILALIVFSGITTPRLDSPAYINNYHGETKRFSSFILMTSLSISISSSIISACFIVSFLYPKISFTLFQSPLILVSSSSNTHWLLSHTQPQPYLLSFIIHLSYLKLENSCTCSIHSLWIFISRIVLFSFFYDRCWREFL